MPARSITSAGVLRILATVRGLWPADRVQIVLQAVILPFESGYRCEEGIVYYRATNQRVRVPITGPLVEEAEAAVANAWKTARQRTDFLTPLWDFPEMPGVLAERDLLARRDQRAGRSR